MEVVRKYVDSQNLMSILSLPETFRNRKLEIIIHPVEEQAPDTQKQDISPIVQSLIGSIPHTDLTLAELREERLGKYETAN